MDFKKSLKNPAEAFDSPQDVANDPELFKRAEKSKC